MLTELILKTIPVTIRTIRRISASSLDGALTFQQLRILIFTHEGMGATQMANTMHISTAAVSKMIDVLVKKGLLSRSEGKDRRCLTLSLTSKGDRIRKLARNAVEKELVRNFKKLSKQELADLKKGLIVLSKLMEHVNEH